MDEFVGLSLDEIIALRNKKNKASGQSRTFRGRGRGRGASRTNFVRRSRSLPIPVVKNFNRRSFPRGNDLCKLVVSNLGAMVTTADLQELFADYPYVKIAVHYDESGRSLGCADVFFKRFEDAMYMKRQFVGVKLDGRLLEMYAIDSMTPRTASFGFSRSPRSAFSRGRISKGGARGSSNRPSFSRRGGGRGGRNSDPRRNMTAEELDRELDLYMRGSKHSKISAP